MYFNVWLALSDTALTEYRVRKQAERDEVEYNGPMQDREYKIFQSFQDEAVVQRLFKSPTIQGTTYNLFSIYVDRTDAQAAQDAITYLTDTYPTQIIVLGVWREDGTQVNAYPINANAWRVMPDVVEYDENGDVLSTTPATSNADLRDINLLFGQQPRDFS